MLPDDIISLVKKVVKKDSPPPVHRSPRHVRRPTRTKTSMSHVYRERYGVTTIPVRNNSYKSDPTAINKLKAALTSSLTTAQETVTKLSPTKQVTTSEQTGRSHAGSSSEEKIWKTWDLSHTGISGEQSSLKAQEELDPGERVLVKSLSHNILIERDKTKDESSTNSRCKVCLKSISPTEFFRICFDCSQEICEDCSSYTSSTSKQKDFDEGEENEKDHWSCTICNRRKSNRSLRETRERTSTTKLLTPDSASTLNTLPLSAPTVSTLPLSAPPTSTSMYGCTLATPTLDIRRHSDGGALPPSTSTQNLKSNNEVVIFQNDPETPEEVQQSPPSLKPEESTWKPLTRHSISTMPSTDTGKRMLDSQRTEDEAEMSPSRWRSHYRGSIPRPRHQSNLNFLGDSDSDEEGTSIDRWRRHSLRSQSNMKNMDYSLRSSDPIKKSLMTEGSTPYQYESSCPNYSMGDMLAVGGGDMTNFRRHSTVSVMSDSAAINMIRRPEVRRPSIERMGGGSSRRPSTDGGQCGDNNITIVVSHEKQIHNDENRNKGMDYTRFPPPRQETSGAGGGGRRKLPSLPVSAPPSRRHSKSRTPSPKCGEMGWIQVCLELDNCQLHVCVMSGEGLLMVETEDTISLPSAYVITYLSNSEYTKFFTTHVEGLGRCPVWKATHTFNLENMKTLRKYSDGGQHITMNTIHHERRQSDYCINAGADLQRHNRHRQDLNLSRHNSIERSQNIVLTRRSSLGQKLGPLQLFYNRDIDLDIFPGSKTPELCITMSLNDGYLNLHVMAGRNIPALSGYGPNSHGGGNGPDTYVKTSLREQDRKFLKKKSRVVTSSSEPFYNHRVKFLASDIPRRSLNVSVWHKPGPGPKFGHSGHCVGEVDISVDKIQDCGGGQNQAIRGWYRLFPPLIKFKQDSD